MYPYKGEAERISKGLLDYLYAYAMAITGTNGETVLIITCDLSWFDKMVAEEVRQVLGQEYSMAPENFILTGTHNHSYPNVGNSSTSAGASYRQLFRDAVLEAGRQAMADRKPATMYVGSANAKGLNFVRRYRLKDGTYPNFEMVDSELIDSHESEPDTQLQVLRFAREGCRDIALFNWQAHANMNMQNDATYYNVSADYVGPFRDAVESALDVDCFMWNGAAGNLNTTSQITSENLTTDHREYGKLLSAYAVEAFNNAVALEAGKVEVASLNYVGTVNHSYDNVLSEAQELLDYYKATGDSRGVREKGKPYGINTQPHASRIVSNAQLGPTQNIPLKAFRIGEVGFICLFYEMFDTNGMHIKTESPFQQTFIVGYNESGLGYIPSSLVEDHGGYEVDNNIFILGTGDLLAEEYIKLLESIHD